MSAVSGAFSWDGTLRLGAEETKNGRKTVSPLPLRTYWLKCKIHGTTVSVREREMLKPVRSPMPQQFSGSFLDCLCIFFKGVIGQKEEIAGT